MTDLEPWEACMFCSRPEVEGVDYVIFGGHEENGAVAILYQQQVLGRKWTKDIRLEGANCGPSLRYTRAGILPP